MWAEETKSCISCFGTSSCLLQTSNLCGGRVRLSFTLCFRTCLHTSSCPFQTSNLCAQRVRLSFTLYFSTCFRTSSCPFQTSNLCAPRVRLSFTLCFHTTFPQVTYVLEEWCYWQFLLPLLLPCLLSYGCTGRSSASDAFQGKFRKLKECLGCFQMVFSFA